MVAYGADAYSHELYPCQADRGWSRPPPLDEYQAFARRAWAEHNAPSPPRREHRGPQVKQQSRPQPPRYFPKREAEQQGGQGAPSAPHAAAAAPASARPAHHDPPRQAREPKRATAARESQYPRRKQRSLSPRARPQSAPGPTSYPNHRYGAPNQPHGAHAHRVRVPAQTPTEAWGSQYGEISQRAAGEYSPLHRGHDHLIIGSQGHAPTGAKHKPANASKYDSGKHLKERVEQVKQEQEQKKGQMQKQKQEQKKQEPAQGKQKSKSELDAEGQANLRKDLDYIVIGGEPRASSKLAVQRLDYEWVDRASGQSQGHSGREYGSREFHARSPQSHRHPSSARASARTDASMEDLKYASGAAKTKRAIGDFSPNHPENAPLYRHGFAISQAMPSSTDQRKLPAKKDQHSKPSGKNDTTQKALQDRNSKQPPSVHAYDEYDEPRGVKMSSSETRRAHSQAERYRENWQHFRGEAPPREYYEQLRKIGIPHGYQGGVPYLSHSMDAQWQPVSFGPVDYGMAPSYPTVPEGTHEAMGGQPISSQITQGKYTPFFKQQPSLEPKRRPASAGSVRVHRVGHGATARSRAAVARHRHPRRHPDESPRYGPAYR